MLRSQFDVVGPEAAGLDPEKVGALLARARQEIDAGILPSCQLAIARHGRIGVFETFGAATADDRYVIFSATKAFVVSAFWLVLEQGLISLDTRVADVIPEFATNGKDVVTVEQVMLHTSGFPYAPLGPNDWGTRESRCEAFGRWRLTWEPGTRFEYHATSAHWVLVELLARVTGRDFREHLRTEVLDPLGLADFELGVASERATEVLRPHGCNEPTPPDELEAALGVRDLGPTSIPTPELELMGHDATLPIGVPGGGGVSSAVDVVRFYQALLTGGPWRESTRRSLTAEVRNSFPDALGVPANRTLGLVVRGDDAKSFMRFGRTCSPATFGHSGAGGQIAWADPATGISFCYLTDGLDEHVLRQWKRGAALTNRAAICAAA
jgi:CubicO group peptidase (beta-lactamase class C family)